MALSGSTRLQAATVQMLAVGAALFTLDREDSIPALIQKMVSEYSRIDLVSFLSPLVDWESKCYQQNEHVLYRTDSYPIAVLTDTTERSPTFTLTPFEKVNETTGPFSWCYLSIPHAKNPLQSWRSILSRDPIGLEWPELNGRLGHDSILEFDFGHAALKAREKKLAPSRQRELMFDSHFFLNRFEMQSDQSGSAHVHSGLKTSIMTHPLLEQILVKLILNTLSLMVMGRMNRYEGNIMTWVKPSNGKLIDRTLRYAEALIVKRGMRPRTRAELTELLFELWNQPRSPDQAILMDMLARLG
jgi:N-acetylmuramic acid 6-phosphate etherase